MAWNHDFNAALIGQDFEIDLGGKTRYNDDDDSAEDPLFSWVAEHLRNRETYSTFMKLMDNYRFVKSPSLGALGNKSYHV